MRKYFEPELKISVFNSEDVVTASTYLNDVQGVSGNELIQTEGYNNIVNDWNN